MVKKILVVDDEKSVRILLERILKPKNFEVITASNGMEALERVRKEAPHLMILDIMMPKMNGWDVCKKIREDPIYKNLPIIVLTAKTEENDQIKGFGLGANAYVPKPFNHEELLLRVKKLLQVS